MVTRHISLDEEHVEKMKPYLEACNGNFGAALKGVINEAIKYNSPAHSTVIDISLLNWMISETDGSLIPDSVLDEMIEPGMISSMARLKEHFDERIGGLKWEISLDLEYDCDRFPSSICIKLRGDPQKIKFMGGLISQYLIKNSIEQAALEIKNVINSNNCMKIFLFSSNKKEALKSLDTYFGGMNEIKNIIRSRPAFWKYIIIRHLSSNYNMVTIPKNYLEDLFTDKIPASELMIENLARKPIQEIPLKEMLYLIKKVYETSRIVDRIDIETEKIVVSHSYRTKEASEKIKNSMVALLEANGHLFIAKSAANIIVLTHRPDIGVKINEVVDNLKTSNNRVDQELIMFMTFLEGLKDFPHIPVSLTALGRRIGTTLMKEYEKENNIKNWDLIDFQKALEIIDSKIHRVSEWKLDGKNLLYTIRKCQIASDGNTFDTYVCHTARETFKGALAHAFGNKAELNINKLLTHGDNFCEVVIRIP